MTPRGHCPRRAPPGERSGPGQPETSHLVRRLRGLRRGVEARPRTNVRARSTSTSFPGGSTPSLRNRRERATPRTAPQTARLGRSTPSTSVTSGRNDDGGTELDSGTTTIDSWEDPATIRSAETTIAGRFLPSSPGLAAPNDTSHTSPRRGSVEVEAIFQRRLPEAHLLFHRGISILGQASLPLGLVGFLQLLLLALSPPAAPPATYHARAPARPAGHACRVSLESSPYPSPSQP